MSLFAELKRRNVFKVGLAYLALGWAVIQAGSTLVPVLHLPEWTLSLVFWLGVAGLPFVLVFAWIYELTPEGLRRTGEVDAAHSIGAITSRRLDMVIIGMLGVAMVLFAADRFIPRPAPPGEAAAEAAPAGAGHARDASADANPDTEGRAHGALLQNPSPAGVAPDDKSIAVLPFVDMSPAKDQEYFSDGISEELLNLLAKIPELKVIARTSSFAFKGKDVPIAEIARQLNVAHVLEGSVRKSGNTVRVTAQLIHASDSAHLWSETYDRPLEDIFAVQDDVAGMVVEQLKISLLAPVPKTRPVDAETYDEYLRIRAAVEKDGYHGDAISVGIDQYKALLRKSPRFVSAWADLADLYASKYSSGEIPVEAGTDLTRSALAKALALDPDHAWATAQLGSLAINADRDLAAASRYMLRAFESEPTNTDVVQFCSYLSRRLGRSNQARALSLYNVARDPLSPFARRELATVYLRAGQYAEALREVKTTLQLYPAMGLVHEIAGEALLLAGDATAALAEFEQEPVQMYRLWGTAMASFALGRKKESDASLTALSAQFGSAGADLVAVAHAYRGEADLAFEWLDKAEAHRAPALGAVPGDKLVSNLHTDPRWLPFLRKIGYAPEQLAAIEFDVKPPEG